jgi:Na+/melibiose symporter-like transporter
MNRRTAEKLQKAGAIMAILGGVIIVVAVIVSIATSPSSPASIALWVIGGALVVVGLILYALGTGGLRVQVGGPQMPQQ